jgi:hypothetical protein
MFRGSNGQINCAQSSQSQAKAEDWKNAAQTAEAGKENAVKVAVPNLQIWSDRFRPKAIVRGVG